MGNHHSGSPSGSASSSTTNLAAVARRSAKGARLRLAVEMRERERRRSMGCNTTNENDSSAGHANHRSFTFGQTPPYSLDAGSVGEEPAGSSSCEGIAGGGVRHREPPRIEINGSEGECPRETTTVKNSAPNSDVLGSKLGQTERRGSASSIGFSKHRAHKVDSRKIVARKRLERGHTTTSALQQSPNSASGRMEKRASQMIAIFQASNGTAFARSLDAARQSALQDISADMKPLHSLTHRSTHHSVSPLLHQHRRSLFGSIGGAASAFHRGSGTTLFGGGLLEDGVLAKEQVQAVQHSWRAAKARIRQFAGAERCFAFYAFDRIFERAPELKPIFGIAPSQSPVDLEDQPEHPFTRHIRLFDNIIDLSVRNAAELETEMLPILFTYGKRHYRAKVMDEFNERTVRLFCSQVVGTMCDLLDNEFGEMEIEAWLQMITYLGRALLSGFEHERQKHGAKRHLHKI